MIEEKDNLISQNNEEIESESFVFDAGTKAKDACGNDVNDSDFAFVQKDKKLRDVKFTTKPTTFFRDAMRRFRKNRSSVVGGIILGVLFVLSLVLPLEFTAFDHKFQVLPYDIENTHPYETNLPMKLLPAGTGFWDGTRKVSDTSLPYELDSDGNIDYDRYVGSYDDESAILDIKNIHKGYSDGYSSSGSGGYAKIEKFAAEGKENQTGYMYCSPMAFSLDTRDYTVSYTLGTREQEGYVDPEWALILYSNDGKIYYLTDFTSDYGTAEDLESENATVVPHETASVDLNSLIKNNTEITSDVTSKNFAIGFQIKSDNDNKVAFYLHDFTISATATDGNSVSNSEKRTIRQRCFGTADAGISDANTLVYQEKYISGTSTANQNYWTTVTDTRFDSADTYVTKCDLVIDAYKVAYGLKSGINIAGSLFQSWISQGYVEYDFNKSNTEAPSTFKVTELGEESGEVYVDSVQSQTSDTVNGEKVYNLTCTVLMYKYLGYKSMPVHLFGTEYQGKDMLKYVFAGLRTSLLLGFLVAIINITIGVIWGSISGFFGGTVDLLMERFTDILSGIPWIILMTVLTLKLGQTFFVFALSLCLTGWIGTESITRSQFYRYRGREYVLAAKTLGARAPRLIFRHILPNAVGTIITSSILMIPSTIFSEATISYLGLGLRNMSSLGVILSYNQKNLSYYPSQLVIPAVIISLLMICFNLFGNGLRDAFNPSLKGTE